MTNKEKRIAALKRLGFKAAMVLFLVLNNLVTLFLGCYTFAKREAEEEAMAREKNRPKQVCEVSGNAVNPQKQERSRK